MKEKLLNKIEKLHNQIGSTSLSELKESPTGKTVSHVLNFAKVIPFVSTISEVGSSLKGVHDHFSGIQKHDKHANVYDFLSTTKNKEWVSKKILNNLNQDKVHSKNNVSRKIDEMFSFYNKSTAIDTIDNMITKEQDKQRDDLLDNIKILSKDKKTPAPIKEFLHNNRNRKWLANKTLDNIEFTQHIKSIEVSKDKLKSMFEPKNRDNLHKDISSVIKERKTERSYSTKKDAGSIRRKMQRQKMNRQKTLG